MQVVLNIKDDYVNEFFSFLKSIEDKAIISKIIKSQNTQEDKEFSKLSNQHLEKIWDNQEDSIYDKFIK